MPAIMPIVLSPRLFSTPTSPGGSLNTITRRYFLSTGTLILSQTINVTQVEQVGGSPRPSCPDPPVSTPPQGDRLFFRTMTFVLLCPPRTMGGGDVTGLQFQSLPPDAPQVTGSLLVNGGNILQKASGGVRLLDCRSPLKQWGGNTPVVVHAIW